MKTLIFIATCLVLALATNICFAQVVGPKPEPCEDELDMSFTSPAGFQLTEGTIIIDQVFVNGNRLTIIDIDGNRFDFDFIDPAIPLTLRPGNVITIRKSQGICGIPGQGGLFIIASFNIIAN